MKKIFFISLLLFLFSANLSLATETCSDIGGECDQERFDEPISGITTYSCKNGYKEMANKYDCTGACCIPESSAKTCTELGGKKCLESKYCGETAGIATDCTSNKVCCAISLCEKNGDTCELINYTGSGGYTSCTEAGYKEEKGGEYTISCSKIKNNTSYQCCTGRAESTDCTAQGTDYYCIKDTTGCNKGDTTASSYTCAKTGNDKQICCKKTSSSPSSSGTIGSFAYPNPLTIDSITKWLTNLLAALYSIVGWLAVIFIVIGGVVYITSGGSSTQATLGKNIIIAALVGFAIAVAAPSLLREIYDYASSNANSNSDVIDNANDIKTIVINVMEFLLTLVGLLSLIAFAISGIMYTTSAGDTKRADTAKNAAFYSILGVAVSGAGLVIIKQVLELIGTKTS